MPGSTRRCGRDGRAIAGADDGRHAAVSGSSRVLAAPWRAGALQGVDVVLGDFQSGSGELQHALDRRHFVAGRHELDDVFWTSTGKVIVFVFGS